MKSFTAAAKGAAEPSDELDTGQRNLESKRFESKKQLNYNFSSSSSRLPDFFVQYNSELI